MLGCAGAPTAVPVTAARTPGMELSPEEREEYLEIVDELDDIEEARGLCDETEGKLSYTAADVRTCVPRPLSLTCVPWVFEGPQARGKVCAAPPATVCRPSPIRGRRFTGSGCDQGQAVHLLLRGY